MKAIKATNRKFREKIPERNFSRGMRWLLMFCIGALVAEIIHDVTDPHGDCETIEAPK